MAELRTQLLVDEVAARGFSGGNVLASEEVVSHKAHEETWFGLAFGFRFRVIVGVDAQRTLFIDVGVSHGHQHGECRHVHHENV